MQTLVEPCDKSKCHIFTLDFQRVKHVLAAFVSPHPYLHTMTAKRRPALRTLICPKCLQKAVLQRILYGMPGSDFDFDKYAVGGCLIEPMQPDIACRECGWRGHRDSLEEI